jgi:hypothetical protein
MESEMHGLRYANIGLAVSMVVLAIGVLAFRNSGDGAIGAVGMVAFLTAFGVYHFLDERAKQREKNRAQ